jgi:hypothetical protein
LTGASVAPGGRGEQGREWAPGTAATAPAARAVFVLLVVACFAAFFITQRLKHTPTAVTLFQMEPRFSPFPSGHVKQEAISFKLTRADTVTVTVIDARGQTVATLVRDHHVVRYKQFSLRWNGRRGSPRGYGEITTPGGRTIIVPRNTGALAPPGEYRVEVSLREQHRTVRSPRSFTLVGA